MRLWLFNVLCIDRHCRAGRVLNFICLTCWKLPVLRLFYSLFLFKDHVVQNVVGIWFFVIWVFCSSIFVFSDLDLFSTVLYILGICFFWYGSFSTVFVCIYRSVCFGFLGELKSGSNFGFYSHTYLAAFWIWLLCPFSICGAKMLLVSSVTPKEAKSSVFVICSSSDFWEHLHFCVFL